jgi:hypothetical protein
VGVVVVVVVAHQPEVGDLPDTDRAGRHCDRRLIADTVTEGW